MEYKNDIGRPWRYEDGEYTVTRTVAWSPPGCHPVACGLKLYVKDGKLVKVEGDENNPVTQGRLCIRCLALPQYLNHPDRILYPMARDPQDRGKDAWKRITLDEAYLLIKERADEISAKYGKESLITFSGTGRIGGAAGSTGACRTLGTPNNCYTQSGYSCFAPRVASTINLLGQAYPEIDYAGGLPGRYDDPLFKLPEIIMVWGKAPLASNPDGMFGHAVIDMMKRGSKLISIDPRVNWLSSRAVKRLRLRPGTDCALAMAMCNIIITENLYDHDFVDCWVYGFDEFSDRVKTMAPERAAEICGLNASDIYEVARLYAAAKPASIAWGLAIDQQANGVAAGHAILGLMAITGNIDVPGGQTLTDIEDSNIYGNKANGKGWNTISHELIEKIIGWKEYPIYTHSTYQDQADMTLKCLETDTPYPLRMGWIVSTNPLACNGDEPERWYKALMNLEFTFATDVWMTPTIMACADLFLPLRTFPEFDGTAGPLYGNAPVYQAAINEACAYGECRSDMQYLFEIGKVVNPKAWEGVDDYRQLMEGIWLERLKLKYDDIKEDVYHMRTVAYRKYESGHLRADRKPGFQTSTGRLELYSLVLANNGLDPLPSYEEPYLSPISQPELSKTYPLILSTGARTYSYFHSEGRQIPYLREINPDPLVEINPEDAKELGIRDGDWVVIENNYGKCRMVAKVTFAVYKGMVMAQHGWWMPNEEGIAPHLYGTFEHNINKLIPNDHFGPTGFGANIKSGLCRVCKYAADGEVAHA